jgi:phage terminase large subunit-like protein
LAERKRRLQTNKLPRYRPYTKQQEFHHAATRERLFMAGNQLGKTWAGAYECAMHLTGRYPEWWKGKRFERPVVGWACGETGELVRDTIQRLLIGREGALGTGTIPADDITGTTPGAGISGLKGTITVAHVSGGQSTLTLKSYNQGREKFQGETLDFIWLDEEPPLDIYTECLTRTNSTMGPVWVTFTPLNGMSDVVSRFLMEEDPDRTVVQMTIDDAEHYSDEDRRRIIASYPKHEREARTKGIPIMGSGRVFPVPEEDITVPSFAIPDHWVWIGGMDFGWDHPTAGVKLAWDRDVDVLYVTATYRKREAPVSINASALKAMGTIRWAWPHDGYQHDKQSGAELASAYRKEGLDMHPEHATHEAGGYGTEAGISEMLNRMETGRFKVFEHLNDWLEEFRLYHRKDGLIVKERDDLMSATRIAVMMRRYAKTARRQRVKQPDATWVT